MHFRPNSSFFLFLFNNKNNKKLFFWNFKTNNLITSLKVRRPIVKTKSNLNQNLIAVACADNSMYIVDVETRSVIRELSAQRSIINDLTFSSDSKWLIVALANCSLLVYDLISTELVDHCLLPHACTSLSMSHSGEFLATAHQGQNGVFVWANMTIYEPTLIRPLDNDHKPRLLDLPVGRPEEQLDRDDTEANDVDHLDELNEEGTPKLEQESDLEYVSPEQIDLHLITLSTVPSSRWKNLVHLDLIKKRNLPKKPAAKPENAPFFLPVLSGVKPTLDVKSNTNTFDESNETKIKNQLLLFSEFGQQLFEAGLNQDYESALDQLKALGPSAVDVEIRSLDALPPASLGLNYKEPILIRFFLEAIACKLETNQDFELCNAYLSVLLKCHSDVILRNKEYSDRCEYISRLIDERWDRVKLTFNETLCVLNYIRNSVI